MPSSNGPRQGLSEMQRAIGRIEGKMDAFIEQMRVQDDRTSKLEAKQEETAAKLETRMRTVERWQHWYAGLGTAIGALLGFGGGHGLKL